MSRALKNSDVSCVVCRGAFKELMERKVRNFRMDGTERDLPDDVQGDAAAMFLSYDNNHPSATGYARMAELAVHLFQQVGPLLLWYRMVLTAIRTSNVSPPLHPLT